MTPHAVFGALRQTLFADQGILSFFVFLDSFQTLNVFKGFCCFCWNSCGLFFLENIKFQHVFSHFRPFLRPRNQCGFFTSLVDPSPTPECGKRPHFPPFLAVPRQLNRCIIRATVNPNPNPNISEY